MTVTDLEIARTVADLYDPVIGSDQAAWTHLDQGGDDDQVYWAIRVVNGVTLVIFRGSILLIDWERDFEALPFQDEGLGFVHAGMFVGMRKAFAEVLPAIANGPWIACGHSLGAGRAALMAGLGVVGGVPPLELVQWGEPRACGDQLVKLLAPVPRRSYRNTDGGLIHDPVTDVPGAPFRHAGPTLIDVVAPPPGLNSIIPTAFHHFDLYLSAMTHG